MSSVQAQTYMYINEANITPEDPVLPEENVSIQLLGDFSDSGGEVVDHNVTLDGTTVYLDITANSDGGLAVLTPFDLSFDLGMYEPGMYTVEITGTGIGVAVEGPLTFLVEEGMSSLPDISNVAIFQMTPNPASEILWVRLNEISEPLTFQLFSLDGQLVKEVVIENTTTKIDVRLVNEGMYIAHLLGKDGVAIRSEKLIVNH